MRPAPAVSGTQALAVRRAAFAAAALAATVTVHAATAGTLDLLPVAPAMWGFLVCAAMLCGSRGAFRARGALNAFGVLLAVQLTLHLVLVKAPWALGVRPHHALPLVTTQSLAGHVTVALLLALVLARGERVLAALTRAAEAVRRVLRPRRARRRVPLLPLAALVAAPVLPLRTTGTPSRGPPPTA